MYIYIYVYICIYMYISKELVLLLRVNPSIDNVGGGGR